MKLSSDTINVLKNFSDINENILFKPGKEVHTISGMKNILAKATIGEEIPQEFGIYNLAEFLNVIGTYSSPIIKFSDSQSLVVDDEKDSSPVKYNFSEKSVLNTPEKMIQMPSVDSTFELKNESLQKVMKRVNTLGLPDLAFKSEDGEIKLVASDKKDPNSNTASIVIGNSNIDFIAYLKTENLKFVPDDYTVEISSKKIAHFINKNRPIEYWVALEPDSEF
jgi:hypothetical protein